MASHAAITSRFGGKGGQCALLLEIRHSRQPVGRWGARRVDSSPHCFAVRWTQSSPPYSSWKAIPSRPRLDKRACPPFSACGLLASSAVVYPIPTLSKLQQDLTAEHPEIACIRPRSVSKPQQPACRVRVEDRVREMVRKGGGNLCFAIVQWELSTKWFLFSSDTLSLPFSPPHPSADRGRN